MTMTMMMMMMVMLVPTMQVRVGSETVDLGGWGSMLDSPLSLHVASHAHTMVTPPACIGEIGLTASPPVTGGRLEGEVVILPGVQHAAPNALIAWWELTMLPEPIGAGLPRVSTGPEAGVRPHWKQMVFHLPKGSGLQNLEAGERIRLVASYNLDRLRIEVAPREPPSGAD
jgi:hypothetical protein